MKWALLTHDKPAMSPVHIHGYACLHAGLCRREHIQFLLWLLGFAQRLFILQVILCLGISVNPTGTISELPSFASCEKYLSTGLSASVNPSVMSQTGPLGSPLGWQVRDCSVMATVNSGFKKQQHKGAMNSDVWSCLWPWNHGGGWAQFWGCTRVCGMMGCCAQFFFLYTVFTLFIHIPTYIWLFYNEHTYKKQIISSHYTVLNTCRNAYVRPA